jgi:hypothetical protein
MSRSLSETSRKYTELLGQWYQQYRYLVVVSLLDDLPKFSRYVPETSSADHP